MRLPPRHGTAAPPHGGGWEGAPCPSPSRFGLLGHGLSHTLSPSMFNAILPGLLPGAEFRVFDVPKADLAEFVGSAHQAGITGLSVTIPHKVAVIPFLDSLDETAATLRAVNCVTVHPDGIRTGHNTDAFAFEACIRALDRHFDSALVLGAGGAARAVVYALRNLGVPLIVIAERRAAASPTADPLSALQRLPFVPEALAREAPEFSLIVNCTPVGMFPNEDATPLPAGFRPGQVVFDLVYRPRPTRLLQLAQSAGATPVDGLCMLARQAADSLRLWTGLDVPYERFLAAANTAGEATRAQVALAPLRGKVRFHKGHLKDIDLLEKDEP